MFGDAGRHTIQHIAFMDFGQGLHGIILFLRLEGCLEQLFDSFPTVLHDGLALGFERIALAGERDLRFCVGVLLAGCTQKAHPDKIEDFLLRLRKRGNILLFKLDGRKNGMVIRDPAVVSYEALLQTMGKDAVIRRENKTKPRATPHNCVDALRRIFSANSSV